MPQDPTYDQLLRRLKDMEEDAVGRHREVQRLLESEQTYRSLFEDAEILSSIYDQDGICLLMNRKIAVLFGLSPEDLIGKSFDELHPEVAGEYKHRVARVIRTGRVARYEDRVNFPSGSRWLLSTVHPISDRSGSARLCQILSIDITDRKRAEKTLREREERLRTLLLASPDPMVMYDVDGVPQILNHAFTDLFGWSLKELKGRRIPFVPDDQKDITLAQIRQVFASRTTTRFETRRLTKDGRTLDVMVSAAIIRDPDGAPAGMAVNLTDMTERMALQARYEQAQRMESLGTLAGGVAHDFNNLLMGIQGRASLMAMEIEPGHRFFEHIHEIGEYVKSASDLTKQLLGFARGGKYEVKPVDLNDLVRTSAEMFGRTKKQIQIRMDLATPIPSVEVDRRQIEQVLLNIYVNAWQAMPDGGNLFIRTSVARLDDDFCRPHGVTGGTFVCTTVADTGIGMDPAVQERIFDPFFTTKEKGRGTGLGLASAFGIVKNHNGLITVDSQVGQGTAFIIYLPSSSQPVSREPVSPQVMHQGSGCILLIDDEELVRTVGRSMLEKLGYRVLTASSGEDAVQILSHAGERVDLVILDLIMPGWDGGQTFEHIRDVDPHLPVLLSSGYAIDGQADSVLKKGCSGFLQKPFTLQELSAKIRAILTPSSAD